MKNNTKRRILSACIALVMLLLLVPFSSFTVVKVEAADLGILDAFKEFSAKSSTAIKKIGDIANIKENKQFSALLKRAGGYASLLGSSIDAIRGGINAFDKNDKWYENIINIGSGAIAGFLGIGASSPDGGTEENPPVNYDFEELKSMIQNMDGQFQDIKTQIGDLEKSMQTNFEQLSSNILNAIDKLEYKTFLNEFTQVNDRNSFSYYSFFKPDLETCYNELQNALDTGSAPDVKQAYDNLYLIAKQSEQLYYYVSGESTILTGKQSIQDMLYDYSVLSGLQDFELICLTFAEDVSSTFTFAQYCLSLCYNYQLEYAEQNNLSYGSYYKVQQGNTDVQSIQISSISSKVTDLLQKQNVVNQKLAKYLSKVLCLSEEFVYTSKGLNFGTIQYSELFDTDKVGAKLYQNSSGENVFYRVNNKVHVDDVIQICSMPYEYIDMFNPTSFTVEVSNDSAIVQEDDTVKVVGTSGSFDVIYEYDGEECYRSTFEIRNYPFSGGMGIDGAPYLISTTQDFEQFRNHPGNFNYLLTNDIDFKGAQLSFVNRVVFNGVLDGGGYKVYNFYVHNLYQGSNEYYLALFNEVGKNGVIKNLTLGSNDCKNLEGESIIYSINVNLGSSYNRGYCAFFAGKNNGIISNCHVQNASMVVRFNYNPPTGIMTNANFYTYAGGLVANNTSTASVVHCSIDNVNLTADCTSGVECLLNIGGFVGYNIGGVVSNCFAKNFIGVAKTNNRPTVSMYCLSEISRGTAVGYNAGSVSNVYADGASTITATPQGKNPSVKYGVNGINLISADPNVLALNGWMHNDDGILELDKNTIKSLTDLVAPYKTTYYLGEKLNLVGMYLNHSNQINEKFLGLSNKSKAYGYMVSGYDPQKLGKQTITVSYEDLTTIFDVTVLCPHDWQQGVETQKPSHTQEGKLTYTCSICGETKDIELNKTPEHDFATYTNFDDQKHQKSCECGAVKLENHSWDQGTETIPATSTQEGEMTYECLLCDATYSESIPKLENVSVIIVGDASAQPGETLQINVRLENNPGVAMLRLKIEFDSTLLTLDEVVYNSAIGGNSVQPVINDGFVVLLWYNENQNVTGDWAFATLNFTVKDDAPMGSVSDVTLTYQADEVCNIEEENVHFDVDNGSASVTAHVAGDINGDGSLTSKDLLRLAKYFAEWDVDVDQSAMDVNGDGVVNSKDLLRLARYLSGWDVEIY